MPTLLCRLCLWVLVSGCLLDAPELAAAEKEQLKPLLDEAAAAESRCDPAAALRLYRQAETLRPDDAAILQKISKQLSDSVSDARSVEERQRLAAEALRYAQRATELAPRDPACVLSVAVCYGKLANHAGIGTRIEYARLVKRYADEALSLNPDYDWAHHVLGRWHYELSQIGGPSRAVAKLLYGGLPEASCAEAVKHLREAARLSPETASHHLELGFAYLGCGDRAAALKQFATGMELPSREKHDEVAKMRARPMYEKLSRERAAR